MVENNADETTMNWFGEDNTLLQYRLIFNGDGSVCYLKQIKFPDDDFVDVPGSRETIPAYVVEHLIDRGKEMERY